MARDDIIGVEVSSGRVLPAWIDVNNHMNVAYYVLAFDQGVDALWDRFGITDWGALVLVGPAGQVLGILVGEGQRRILVELLEEARARGTDADTAALPDGVRGLIRLAFASAALLAAATVMAEGDDNLDNNVLTDQTIVQPLRN